MQYKSSLTTRREIIIHSIFWLITAYFTLIKFKNIQFDLVPLKLFEITWAIIFVSSFYFNYLLVLPRLFKPFRWWKVVAGVLCNVVFFTLLRYFIEELAAYWLFGQRNYFEGTPFWYYLFDNFYFGTLPMILSTFFWLVIFVIRLYEYNKFIIEEQKNTEIKFLKAQINPHFIFNTLNNIYSMVYFQSPKSLPAIEKLSSIMRFTTYESQKEKIKLTDELNYIQSYIQLEELRHEQEDFVQISVAISDNKIVIPPYILSPFVENALKHGQAAAQTPIQIRLEATMDALTFTVANTIGQQKKDKLGGIGLENVKRRLQIYYPDRHRLVITNTNNIFTIELSIQLIG
jgi:two-component system LytT family sensor kinase